jgi:hypothetical protein
MSIVRRLAYFDEGSLLALFVFAFDDNEHLIGDPSLEEG